MRVAIHQPEYLPWLGYFNKVRLCDLLVIEDQVQYRRQRFQNRNAIKTPMGPRWLTVPIHHNSLHTMINMVRINNKIEHGSVWHERHLRTLRANYGRAKFFDDYIDAINSVYQKDWQLLADCNIALLKVLFRILGINVRTKRASELGVTTAKNERIIEICKRVGADVYVTGRGGLNYLNKQLFEADGITVLLNDYKHPSYSQRFMKLGFIPNLSVVDLIFNHGKSSLDIIKSASAEKMPILAR